MSRTPKPCDATFTVRLDGRGVLVECEKLAGHRRDHHGTTSSITLTWPKTATIARIEAIDA